MKKKSLAILLAACCLVSAAAGCTSGKKTESSDETVTLKWFIPCDTQKDSAVVLDEFNKKLKEKINAQLDLQILDFGAYEERMKMNMTADTDFDLMFTGFLNKYNTCVDMECLYPLNDFLKDSKLKDILPDYVWEDATRDGEIYAVPNYQIMATQRCLVFQKDIVNKYGWDITTLKGTEDIEPLLEELKNNEPEMYPFRSDWGLESFASYDDPLFYDFQTSGVAVTVDDNNNAKCEIIAEREDTKEKAKKLNDWFKKGYIRKDIVSVNDDTQDQKSGKYGIEVNNYKPGGDKEGSSTRNYEIVSQCIAEPYLMPGASTAAMTGIYDGSKHPEKAFELIELLNTDKEMFNLLCYGIEGKHYNKTGDDRIELVKDSGYCIQPWILGSQFNAYFVGDQSDTDWDDTKKMNDEARKSKLLGFTFDNKNLRTEISQIENVISKYKIVKTGAEDPDTYWDSYVAELKQAGIEKVRDELQQQVDEFLKNSK